MRFCIENSFSKTIDIKNKNIKNLFGSAKNNEGYEEGENAGFEEIKYKCDLMAIHFNINE